MLQGSRALGRSEPEGRHCLGSGDGDDKPILSTVVPHIPPNEPILGEHHLISMLLSLVRA